MPGVHAHGADSAPPILRGSSSHLGAVALVLAAVAVTTALAVGVFVSPFMPDEVTGGPVHGWSLLLIAVQIAWTLLGLAAMVLGIVAAVTSRGKPQGVAAIIVAVAGAFCYWML